LSATGWAQTGITTVSSGSTSLAGVTNSTSAADQSGIYVYGGGSLAVGVASITTSGSASSTTSSDQYVINAGVLAGNTSTTGTVVITNGTIITTGSVANGLFATSKGSSVTMLGGSINCSGANAHCVDATQGGSIVLSNVTVISSNADSSAIATDYGGGFVTMIGGSALAADTASGSHSASVYSTGIISVKDGNVTFVADCGGVVDGANSILLTNTAMTGLVEGIKVWRTASVSGTATVVVNGGSLISSTGDGFYVTGTAPGGGALGTITVLSNATVRAGTGNLLNSDSGSTAILTINAASLAGNIVADSTSTNYIALTNGAALTGCINTAKTLAIFTNCTWNATSNSIVTALSNAVTIHLNGKITTPDLIVKDGGVLGGGGLLSSNLTLASGATLILNSATNIVVDGSVFFGGAVTVEPSTTNLAAGTYPLLTYGKNLSGTPTFTYTNAGQTAVFSTATSGVIYVTISAPVTIPDAPTNLTATAGDSQISLTWTAVTAAASYYVKCSPVSGGDYSIVGSTTTTNFTATGLADGTVYFFGVTGTNNAGESPLSSEISARPIASVSTNLTLTAGASVLTISWPADHTGWILQAQTNSLSAGLGTNWVEVTDSALTNQITLPVAPTNPSVFYRLDKSN
jgi:hypothetical protein